MRTYRGTWRDGAVIAGAVLGLAALIGPARALDSCSGQYSAAALHPLPVPTVVKLNLRDSSQVNVNLATAFTAGMQQAGLQVEGTPTVTLSITFTIFDQGGSSGPGPAQPGGTGTGSGGGSDANAPWLQGGWTAQLPDMPRYGLFTSQQPAQSGLLVLRVEATDWVGSIQCTLLGSDDQNLAFQLGYRIGGTLGQRVDQTPL